MGDNQAHTRPFFDRILVKFREGGEIHRADDGRLFGKQYSLDPFHHLLAQTGTVRVRRSYSAGPAEMREFQDRLEGALGRKYPFLNLHVRVYPRRGTDLRALARRLSDLGEIEYAVPAGPLRPAQPPAPPDYGEMQGYLRPASQGGIDADHAWTCPGGDGREVTVCDCEWGYNEGHVDLPGIGVVFDGDGKLTQHAQHGTKTLGTILAPRPGVGGILGTTGIAHGAEAKFSSISAMDTGDEDDDYAPDAIQAALDALSPGDVLLIEMEEPLANCYFGPAEWRTELRDAISLARDNGITVVQPAGNGNDSIGADLASFAHPVLGNLWDGSLADEEETGAIIVGAGWAYGHPSQPARKKRKTSNYGVRVDCQGWGNGVYTTGSEDETASLAATEESWTNYDGTSSAAAVVAGAVACLQSTAKAVFAGTPLHPDVVRDYFRDRALGSPQPAADAAANPIGSLPDLAKIFHAAGIYPDLYVRDHLHDAGAATPGEPRMLGTDILPEPHPVLDPDGDFGVPHWEDPVPEVNFRMEERRHVYLRARNRGTVPDRARVFLSWSRLATWHPPSLWKRIGFVDSGPVGPDGHVVLDPLRWVPPSGGRAGPAVLIAECRSSVAPEPRLPRHASTEEFLDSIHQRNDVRFRNVWHQAAVPGAWTDPLRIEFRGLRDRAGVFDFRMSARVPPGTEVELVMAGSPRAIGTKPIPASTSDVFRFEAPGAHPMLEHTLPLPEKARKAVDLRLRLPGGAPAGSYALSIRQLWGGRLLGRLTVRLRVE